MAFLSHDRDQNTYSSAKEAEGATDGRRSAPAAEEWSGSFDEAYDFYWTIAATVSDDTRKALGLLSVRKGPTLVP